VTLVLRRLGELCTFISEWNTSIYFTWKPQYSAYIYIINIIIPSILFTFVLFYRFVYFVPWNFCNQFFGHMLLDIVIYNKLMSKWLHLSYLVSTGRSRDRNNVWSQPSYLLLFYIYHTKWILILFFSNKTFKKGICF
jgi:hypothetical protein